MLCSPNLFVLSYYKSILYILVWVLCEVVFSFLFSCYSRYLLVTDKTYSHAIIQDSTLEPHTWFNVLLQICNVWTRDSRFVFGTSLCKLLPNYSLRNYLLNNWVWLIPQTRKTTLSISFHSKVTLLPISGCSLHPRKN